MFSPLFDRQFTRCEQFVFEMESDQDFPSTFSKLNVNAVEFVPSFAATTKEPDEEQDENAKPIIETPENNGNGESYANLIDKFERRKNLPHRREMK